MASRDGDRGTCSSVIFAEGFALTAAHCVQGDGLDVTIDGRYATVHRSNRLLDLAVVKFAPRASDVIVPMGATPDRGREVAIIGFAFAKRDPTATFGRVAVPRDEEGFLVLNADVIFGQSGCPVINRQGRLVGITSAIQANGPAHLGLAIPVTTVAEFVADLLPKPKP
jgi:S1-C subfamily serine protease